MADVGVAVVGAAVVVVFGGGVVPVTVVADGVEDAVPPELQPDMASATVMTSQGGIVLQRMRCSDSVVGAATVLADGCRSTSTKTQRLRSDFRRVAAIGVY